MWNTAVHDSASCRSARSRNSTSFRSRAVRSTLDRHRCSVAADWTTWHFAPPTSNPLARSGTGFVKLAHRMATSVTSDPFSACSTETPMAWSLSSSWPIQMPSLACTTVRGRRRRDSLTTYPTFARGELIPRGAPTAISAETAFGLLNGLKPDDPASEVRLEIAIDHIEDVMHLDRMVDDDTAASSARSRQRAPL